MATSNLTKGNCSDPAAAGVFTVGNLCGLYVLCREFVLRFVTVRVVRVSALNFSFPKSAHAVLCSPMAAAADRQQAPAFLFWA